MQNRESLISSQPGREVAEHGPTRLSIGTAVNAAANRCLVVDDDAEIMRLVAEMLASLGHQVDVAGNGVRAIKRLSACHYDLVVTDLEMPQIDGLLLTSIIKGLSGDTKTVIMTGRSPAEVAGLKTSAAVDAWLFKPFGLSALRNAIDELASNRQ